MSGKNNEAALLECLRSEVHVWYCCPDDIVDKNILDEFYSILSVEEREKCKRFYFEKDRRSYLVSHALVRKILSSYCVIQPDEWLFTTNEYGKPDISAEIKSPAIKFNLSHTDGMSVVAVTLKSNCGVDVENITRKCQSLAVAERMFAAPEVAVIRDSDDAHSKAHFFEYWTLREAYVKALGTGLGGSSKEFYFTVEEAHQESRVAKLNFVEVDCKKSSSWSFVLLKPSSEHVVAVSFEMNKSDKSLDKSLDESVNVICRKFQL